METTSASHLSRRVGLALAALVVATAAQAAEPRPGAAGTQQSSSPIAGLSDEYRLGPGDKLRIEVYKDPQLSQSVQIRPDGKITLPLVGDIDATGKTPLELRDRVAEALKQYL